MYQDQEPTKASIGLKVQAKADSPMGSSLESLFGNLEELHLTISTLSNRLNPVSVVSMTESANPDDRAVPQDVSSPHRSSIKEATERVAYARQRVLTMIEELEI